MSSRSLADQEAVRDVRLLLEGRNTELADTLEGRMGEASEGMHYELAAKYRDLRKTVIKLSEQQKMASSPERDVDIFTQLGRCYCACLFRH